MPNYELDVRTGAGTYTLEYTDLRRAWGAAFGAQEALAHEGHPARITLTHVEENRIILTNLVLANGDTDSQYAPADRPVFNGEGDADAASV